MSVRIHQLSKKIGMENNELLSLLKERGYDVKTASSSIDNISAEALVEEFAAKAKEASEADQPEDASPAPPTETEAPAPSPKLPSGPIVKTAEDLEREKREKKEREEEQRAARTTPPPPAPRPAARVSAPTPPPPTTPPSQQGGAGRAPKLPPPVAGRPPAPPPRSPDSAVGKSPAVPPPPRPAAGAPGPVPPRVEPKAAAPEGASGEEGDAPPRKRLQVKPPIVVRDFAVLLGLKPFRLISELMERGVFASMNQSLDEESAMKIARTHGFELEILHRGEGGQKKKEEKPKIDESKLLESRPPVVCILGHVDHGKTTLLDVIRKTNVVQGEAGGITQHIGAYQVEQAGNKLTFLDTPGHAAFSKMRERGANVTDVAVLVVAADDGFMPQTDEALDFANRAQVAKIVAVNKMDLPGADLEKVKNQMAERGIPAEDWGGETIVVPISAIKGEGIDALLEMIQLQTEIMELKANPKADPEGIIIESQLEQGRGPVATVIVQRGTLKVGDTLICGTEYCRVRALLDDAGNPCKTAPPSTPVRVIGWSDAPEVGGRFETRKNERAAKKEAEERAHALKLELAAARSAGSADKAEGTGLEALFAAIEKQEKKVLRVLLRADVAGSLEALSVSLKGIKSDKVGLDIVQEDVGLITKNDVELADAAGATIVGFNTRMENGVQGLAKHHGVLIYQHNIIYELIQIVEDAMADLLEPELVEHRRGSAEVRQVFSIGKGRNVAGCMVIEGLIRRDGVARVMRGGEQVHDGRLDTLRRFKDDVAEVRAGYECGIHLVDFEKYEVGDIIECFEIEKRRPSL